MRIAQVSCVSLNCAVPEEKQAHVAKAVLDLLNAAAAAAAGGQQGPSVILAAANVLPKASNQGGESVLT